jgi:hypothetical protein
MLAAGLAGCDGLWQRKEDLTPRREGPNLKQSPNSNPQKSQKGAEKWLG